MKPTWKAKVTRCFATAAAIAFLMGCTTLSSGRKYTLAKVDQTLHLVEPRLVPETGAGSTTIAPTEPFGIVLNSGYLRYLQSIERPEVVIFLRVRVRPTNGVEEALVWEKVYLNSDPQRDEDNRQIVLNKDSFLPRDDIPLMPPILYEGQDIFVELRIIELDQADNARTRQLINAAASTAAAFQPESAVGISVFQTVLSFLVANNADDIEFQYDFAISDTPGPITYQLPGKAEQKYDMVLSPRIAKYAVVKTEHRSRTNIPSNYLHLAGAGIQYTLAEVVRLATLNTFNWLPGIWDFGIREPCGASKNRPQSWQDRQDWYQWFAGDPFGVDPAAAVPPTFNFDSRQLKSEVWPDYEFVLSGNRLAVHKPGIGRSIDFIDQGYLVFSLVPAKNGVDLAMLKELTEKQKVIDALNLSTGQLAPEEFEKSLGAVTDSLKAYAAERQIRQECSAAIGKAATPEAVQTETTKCKGRIAELKGLLTSETATAALENAEGFVDQRAKVKQAQLEKFTSLSGPYIGEGRKGEGNKLESSVRIPLSPEEAKTCAARKLVAYARPEKSTGAPAAFAKLTTAVVQTCVPDAAYISVDLAGVKPAAEWAQDETYEVVLMSESDPTTPVASWSVTHVKKPVLASPGSPSQPNASDVAPKGSFALLGSNLQHVAGVVITPSTPESKAISLRVVQEGADGTKLRVDNASKSPIPRGSPLTTIMDSDRLIPANGAVP